MPTITQYGANNSLAQEVPDLDVVIVPPQLILTGAPSNVEGVVGVGSWGPINTPSTVSGLADATAAVGAMTARKHDITTAVYVGALQGSNDFRVVRVGDGTQTAALADIPSADLAASPTFFVALAAAINAGSGVLRGASQVASLDGASGSRRLEASLHVAADGLAIQTLLPSDRGQAQALPMEIQDQDNFPKPDHPRSPPDRQGKGGLLPGSAPQRRSHTHTATKWGIFNRPIWGNYERH